VLLFLFDCGRLFDRLMEGKNKFYEILVFLPILVNPLLKKQMPFKLTAIITHITIIIHTTNSTCY